MKQTAKETSFVAETILHHGIIVVKSSKFFCSITRETNEYVLNNEDIENRDDELMRYSASLNYQARRYLSFSLFYQLNRDSNRGNRLR